MLCRDERERGRSRLAFGCSKAAGMAISATSSLGWDGVAKMRIILCELGSMKAKQSRTRLVICLPIQEIQH